ncbi:DUF1080 domain-containing protein [Sphingobacterium sp. UT-1RO-CII-1]|uniref:3-keto-disaccharide hydrolase n=1 Tax=Sphingobacterium sp. UT-1RO-CII-1 TaxID=2995225 RepID=UPI00227AACB3|nr:DUF1080 domain-containing protein [Sphingobacterium sp. UT-1RO-CII-1]MCY4779669.1 DUF1080 domain-containing protein [Sphingobacterium sp. UT-1RO-CII-1]
MSKKQLLLIKFLLVALSGSFTASYSLASNKEPIKLDKLHHFKSPSKSWTEAGDANADYRTVGNITVKPGIGIIANLPTKKNLGEDLFTAQEFGDMDIELDYLMVSGGNSGIYLQGRYEVQLEDSWQAKAISAGSNGGIYGLSAPRFNVSKAPGLWQHLKISFQAPRFDGAGHKIENARILSVFLNGVLVQENVELTKPTPGAVSENEVATASLRIQGDHGAVAYKNIVITENPSRETKEGWRSADPIWVDAVQSPILRSFMDVAGAPKIVHAVSVGNPAGLHYTYDLDHGLLVQAWRGGFLDATPMWDNRGNGTSRPLGTVQVFSANKLQVARLANDHAEWPSDTAGTGFRTKGYTVNVERIPTFKYELHGKKISDRTDILDGGTKLGREIVADGLSGEDDLYVLVAEDNLIKEVGKNEYIVGDKAYYLQLDLAKKSKAIVRENNGKQQLLVKLEPRVYYTIIL